MSRKKPKVITICGPTATGKTSVSIGVAQALETEIISADSRLVYKELNIGTAKPTQEERKGITHHMIDIVSPAEQFSAAQYQSQAEPILEQLLKENRIPLVVGGTGFYHRSLLEETILPDVPPNEAFRGKMQAIVEEKGPEYLHEVLAQKDPHRAKALYPQDAFRIIRALEIIHETGKPVPNVAEEKPFEVIWVALTYDNWESLRQKIQHRVDQMIDTGWIEEVESLIQKYGADTEALKVSHGYSELVQYLQGKTSLEETKEIITIAVQQYARRQRTWFKKNKNIHWLTIDTLGESKTIEKTIKLTQID